MLKEVAKGILVKRQRTSYKNQLKKKSNPYDKWQHDQEKAAGKDAYEDVDITILDTEIVHYADIWKHSTENGNANKILIFLSPKGYLTKNAENEIKRFFLQNQDINVVYADEDQADDKGNYLKPFFKPDWSPDSYLNAFYIGSIFACRERTFCEASSEYDNAVKMLGGSAVQKNSPEAVGFEASLLSADVLFCMLAIHEHAFARRTGMRFPIGHIEKVLFHRDPEQDVFYSRAYHNSKHMLLRPAFVSIIIPSKDHSDLVEQCIDSIMKTTNDNGLKFEIIIVDNGSNAYHRVRYGSYINSVSHINGLTNIKYLYHAEEFNFSHMCNKGAREARGEYLLFLNDDVEAIKEGWLRELVAQAQLKHVGAVGCKLLYPDSDLIQHCGITNVKRGPVHKLQRMHDKRVHYHGFNRGVHNMLGVTGACLMVSRSKYIEVGGFPEELAVAFNDVDICYSIFEKGYYNVCCNHIALFHHESLSRGIDTLDAKKLERLKGEYEILSRNHKTLYNYDPYYSQNLIQDETISAIMTKEDYTMDEDLPYEKVTVHENGYRAKQDAVLRIGVEYAETMERWLYDIKDGNIEDGYFFKGYCFVIGSDNAFFERKIVLRQVEKGESGAQVVNSKVYSFGVYTCYRPDIRARLSDQINVDLTGYKARIKRDAIPSGYYQIGMIAIDKTSKLRLINWVPNIINIK
ncbi:MAG: glycosyltransferase [Butyrivibrio sp.]|nr:glycosyltransferase [Butyrivibrio sp.]